MTTRHFIIATAGHVDHGKSALIQALTGTDTDRLPEEKARGITIDLGFAQLNLTAPNGDAVRAGIVDVPGHEDFVRNMIAGVGSIDLALLVVASDDGWMPQTEEHLQILSYLEAHRAVIALTKSDAGQVDIVKDQICNHLRDSPFESAQIVPTSVRTGEGIEDLKSALVAEFASMQPQRDFGKPRLFIDRAFTLHGIGTVVTGTLTGGELRRGQTVVVQPRNFEARIRSIQSHGSEVEFAQPGMRTAINLPDVGVDQIKRGDVITLVNLGEASANVAVRLEKSSRLGRKNPAGRPLKSGSSAHLHHGTSRVAARVILFEGETLEPGKKATAQLKLEYPIFAFLGDRFVIRDASEQHTIAGGIVVDPEAGEKHFRTEAQRELLAARACAPDDVELCLRTEIARHGSILISNALRKSRFSAERIAAAVQCLLQRNEIFSNGVVAADVRSWEEMRGRAVAFIQAEHRAHPERVGVELADVRAKFSDLSAEVFDALLVDLTRKDFIRVGSTIAFRAHRPALPSSLQALAETILAGLSEKPFDPPNRKESSPESCKALKFLIEQGEVVELAPDIFLTRTAFAQMKIAISRFISAQGAATVSQLRQELQTSRRIIVPLLELLDKQGVTRRIGDNRTLAKQSMTTARGALD